LNKPHYRLQSKWEDGSESKPEIYGLEEFDHTMKVSRRGFIALTTTAAALVSGCTGIGQGYAHFDMVIAVAYSPDGSLIATLGEENLIKIWEASSGSLKKVLTVSGIKLYAIAFSTDGRRIASCGSGFSFNNEIKISHHRHHQHL
jgi:WD40 repeat protein